MKLWFGMQGENTDIWKKWFASVKQWGRTEDVRWICGGNMNMAEACIQYDETILKHSDQANLPYPVILDGWVSGKLHAKSDGTTMFFKHYEALCTALRQDDKAELLSRSHGEFTLCWWDESLESLVLATDIYATRPIYYWIGPEGEWFAANDLRILMLVPDIPFVIDEEVCKTFPTSGFAVGENGFEDRTFFKGIYKVPAASYAFLDQRSVKVHSYWGMPQLLKQKDLTEDAVPHFRELFREVTADRLKDQKHIIELSGGLDSATVTAAAISGGSREQLLAVNISFADPDMILSHDRELVKNMMKDLNIPGLIILGDGTAKIPNAEIGRDPLWFVDGPDPRANSLVNETFTVIAEEFGASSVLTGEGGDFIFSGEVAVIDSLIRQKRFSEANGLLREWSGGRPKEMIKLGFRYGIAPFVPYLGEKLYYDLLWSDTEYELPEYFTEEHKLREREINREDHLRYRKSRKLSSWGKRFHFDFLWPRARYMDSVGVSLPAYHPFLDRRLIEFSFSVPPEQHFDVLKGCVENYAGSKMLLRKSFTDILPSYVYNRSTKTTYAHMARKSFLNDRRHILQLFEPGERVLVDELGIIKRDVWWKHLLSMAIRSEDPNNDLGMGYQYMRSVIDLEIWLREASKGKRHLLERSRPKKPRVLADIETVNMTEKTRLYSYQ
ncbi:asparagine synthetase B family protein [Bacillus swezeyi]|uniref:asparagine synthetase B family protein n=1 Tax=Bacillus swezeyi TaxID=1925020 RepID=UPI0027DCE370|nr:asparagine synthetase B family protein [Bacillus swezeyi]